MIVTFLFLTAGLVLTSGADDAATKPTDGPGYQPREYLDKFHAEIRRNQDNSRNVNDSDLVLQPRAALRTIQHDDADAKSHESACSKKLTKVHLSPGEYSTIFSANYPDYYPRKSKCKWRFTTDKGNYLYVSCYNFELEPENRRGKCVDYLKINKDKFCGTNAPSESAEDQMFVQFKSNKKRSDYSGFYCYVDAYSKYYSSTQNPNPSSTQPPKPKSTLEPGSVQCGIANQKSRIVGGQETTVNEYPWQAAMAYRGQRTTFCGGSVISTKYVITAAHCTQAVKDYSIDYDVLLGAHCLSSSADSEKRIKPQKYIQHPQYDDWTMDNDISIIVLKTAVNFETSEIRPICLPPKDAGDFIGKKAIVSGWGATEEGKAGPDCLHDVAVPIITNTKCDNYNSDTTITSNMICAGYDKGEKDSCQGDSGGPLFYDSGCGNEQLGVVSFGYGCARPKKPGVYARVTEYIDWIKKTLGSYPTYSCRT